MADRLPKFIESLTRRGKMNLGIAAVCMAVSVIGILRLSIVTEFSVFMSTHSPYADTAEEMSGGALFNEHDGTLRATIRLMLESGAHPRQIVRDIRREAVRETMSAVGVPIIMTTVTTMAGFLSMLLIDSPAIRQMGLIAWTCKKKRRRRESRATAYRFTGS